MGPLSPRQHRCFLVLGACGFFFILAAFAIYPQSRYGHASQRIRAKILSINARKPANIDAKLWDECVTWAVTAHCNICFSEGHTKYIAMLDYEKDLDEKLKGEVDLETLKWIGERLEKTGPHGQQYFVTVRWWEMWDFTLRAHAKSLPDAM
jgi:hypothetical protein